jgi:ELWxxDGT repeat protein
VAPIATVVNDRFLFRASDSEHGIETWTSDATAAGTRLLVNAGFDPTTGSQPQTLTPFGNGILFSAYDGFEWGLWSSDGSEAHTVRLSRLSYPVVVSTISNGIFWFAQNQKELWRSDGTAAGTYRTTFSMTSSIDELLPYRNGVAVNGDRHAAGAPVRFWFTDGTPAGTAQFNIAPDDVTRSIAVSGDFVYFGNRQPGGRKVVMRTDGTWPGTKVAAELSSSVFSIDVTASGNLIYVSDGSNLWRIDPDQSVLIPLGGFNNGTSTIPSKAFGVSRFAAAGFGANVLISDGTPAGTFVAASTFAGGGFIVGGSNIYWLSTKRLWISDGTRVGTRTVALDDDPAIQDVCYCATAAWADGHLYFRHPSTATGTELWITDATAAGTHLVADINPGPASSMPANFVLSGSTLFFTAHNASYGEELWALPLGPRRHVAVR